MIRIDEIYTNTFRTWFEHNRPGTRLFFCDPPGNTRPDALFNIHSETQVENTYVFMHDQEPVHNELYDPLFSEVNQRGEDIWWPPDYFKTRNTKRDPPPVKPVPFGHVVVSEKGECVEELCKRYEWTPHYYFFHGWAALDWYRGYDKTFLMLPPEQRRVTKTFISPNRIVAGERQHRLQMLYWIFKLGMTDNHISCPTVCPAENVSIYDAIKSLPYTDAQTVFNSVELPIQYSGETDHPMHSCWLSLFDESADSLLYLVTETVATGRRLHLTEKTFKPICLRMPFIIVGTQGSLAYLRSYGFKTFGHLWDESYDDEPDDLKRIELIAQTLKDIDEEPVACKQKLFAQARDVIEHNYQHFYGGNFEKILWAELQAMLNEF